MSPAPSWMCPLSLPAFRPQRPALVSVWLITAAAESLQYICSTQPMSGRCLLPLLMSRTHSELRGKSTSPVGVRCVREPGVGLRRAAGWDGDRGGGVVLSNKHVPGSTDRETDRQKPTHLFLLHPSLISSVLFFFFFFHRCAVLLFSLRDETQDAALCCLSAFNICLPLPTFSISSPCSLLSSPALIFVPVSSPGPISQSLLKLSYILFTLLHFSLTPW